MLLTSDHQLVDKAMASTWKYLRFFFCQPSPSDWQQVLHWVRNNEHNFVDKALGCGLGLGRSLKILDFICFLSAVHRRQVLHRSPDQWTPLSRWGLKGAALAEAWKYLKFFFCQPSSSNWQQVLHRIRINEHNLVDEASKYLISVIAVLFCWPSPSKDRWLVLRRTDLVYSRILQGISHSFFGNRDKVKEIWNLCLGILEDFRWPLRPLSVSLQPFSWLLVNGSISTQSGYFWNQWLFL